MTAANGDASSSVISALVVFRAPFDEAAAVDEAEFGAVTQYGLIDYRRTGGACEPAQPAEDRFGRRGWSRVYCTISLAAATGSQCSLPGSDGGIGKCTGTLWQSDLSEDYMRDTHAKLARFKVILLHSQRTGAIVPRVWQVPPLAPRLPRPP